MEQDDYQDLVQKYKERVKEEFGDHAPHKEVKVSSREYSEFKSELYPAHYSIYEKACNFSGNLMKLKVDLIKAEKVQKNLDVCHLNVTPSGVTSFAILAGLFMMLFGSVGAFAMPLLLNQEPLFFLVGFAMLSGLILIPALQKVPSFMANTWRMKASNQMVQSIFYMVTYMRHTSNLERAIKFSADHLEPPLSLDLRKILWDVETEKFPSIKDAAEAYLENWKEWDKEFVEAFHLIESSLFESSEDRRLALLDKALDVILNGTYENMLHYAHNLKGPMTMLHMLGIILPILGLVILPLVVGLMSGGSFTKIAIISLMYNVSIPIGVFYLGKNILSKRPAGYGASDISKKKGIKKYRNVLVPIGKKLEIKINPIFFSLIVFAVLFIIGMSPIVLHAIDSEFEIQNEDGTIKMMHYICPPDTQCPPTSTVGPFGLGAAVLSILVVIGFGVSIGLYFSLRSKNVIKIRRKTKELEDEFSSALFQLGNRLGDGLPAELAFGKVADTMKGTNSGEFFAIAEKNITKLGMGLEESIFNPTVGALATFPSNVIQSSMKVLTESVKKGPRIAAQALLSMSRYIKEIHRVEERLKDLMADVIGSMKSQVKFMMPAISGIVIGISSMISTILTNLSAQLGGAVGNDVTGAGSILDLFGVGVPTFFFQISVGIYVVQMIYILTILANGIENGADKLGERYELGKNLIRSTITYCGLAMLIMLMFNLFAVSIIGKSLV